MDRATHVLALAWLAAAGGYLLSIYSPFSPDSWVYLAAASSLSNTGSLTLPFAPTDAASLPAPYSAWPPGYPALIALLATTGMSFASASRLLSAAGLLGGLFFTWRLVRTSKTGSLTLFLIVVSSLTATIGITAWSEGLFFAMMMGSAWAMYRWVSDSSTQMRHLWVAALFAMAAMQLRYAGLFLIPAMIWITWQRGLRLQKWAGTCLHLLSGVPLLLWFIRNSNLASNWRGGDTTHIEWWRAPAELCLSISRLCAIPDLGHAALGSMIGASLLALGAAGVYQCRRRSADKDPVAHIAIAFFLALALGSMLARALGHMWILDARIMWPAWIFAVILGMRAAPAWIHIGRRAMVATAIIWLVLQSAFLLNYPLRSVHPEARVASSSVHLPSNIEGPILCNDGWTAWHLTGRANFYLSRAYYGQRVFSPDTLHAWSAHRGVQIALWIDHAQSEKDIEAMYGPLGLAMSRADTTMFRVISQEHHLTWLHIK
jgi:hypothetical protein